MGVELPLEPIVSARRQAGAAVRAPRRQRALGLIAALAFEALVVILLLTLGTARTVEMAGDEKPLSTFDLAAAEVEPAERVEPAEPSETRVAERQPQVAQPVEQPPVEQTRPTPPSEAPPVQTPPPVVQLSRDELAAADLRSMPSTARPRAPAGPPAPRGEADTPLVDGQGPNGERLYAASWYREPYDSELKGYLSTAQPGWALIACRTVPDYRVDDCVAIDEQPRGSQLARAVLAAAWQFKVRPPRIGGRVQVGEWVRIRIDYGISRRNAWERDRG